MMAKAPAARPLATIRKESIEAQVFDVLRREVLEGRLKSGQRLVQDDLATALGTSRIPVRSALAKLESSGLLTLDDRGAYVVASFGEEDVGEIYGLRSLLEPYAALRALPNFSTARLNELKAINAEIADVVRARDNDRWGDLNATFHMRIYDAAGQPRLIKILRDLWVRRPSLASLKNPEQLWRSHAEHDAIIAAIEMGDAPKLETLVRAHIRGAGKAWLKFMASRAGQD
jgi:DNA-binding GntR family transcriptional regulator